MVTTLTVLSYFGVIQSLILAALYFRGYGKHERNSGIGWLFLLFSAAMMAIVLSKTMEPRFREMLEVTEYMLTFCAGPILYLVVVNLRRETGFTKGVLMLHFTPAISYLGIATGMGLNSLIPVLIPILHMQAYSVWLLVTLWQDSLSSENQFAKSGRGWLNMLSTMLVFIHTAQWIRTIFAEEIYLEFLVPITGFIVIYGLIIYGFVNPSLYPKSVRSDSRMEIGHYRNSLKMLEQTMKDHKIYKNNNLTLEKLALEVAIPSYEISYIINSGLNKNFNEWINQYRVNHVKKMLNDVSNQHLTIEALAKEAGFNSRSSFYNAFKKLTGTTPTKYQEHN